MHRTIILLNNSENQQACASCCMKKLLSEQESSSNKASLNIVILPLFVDKQHFKKIDVPVQPQKPLSAEDAFALFQGNLDLKAHGAMDTQLFEQNSVVDSTLFTGSKDIDVSEKLHEIADSLPYLGDSLHVVLLLDSRVMDNRESVVPLSGALYRLQHWHSAIITVIKLEQELSPYADSMARNFLHCQVVNSPEEWEFSVTTRWMGPVAVMDRVKDSGYIFPGFNLECNEWDGMLEEKLFPPTTHYASTPQLMRRRSGKTVELVQTPLKTTPQQPVCGRTVEILQELHLESIPWMLWDKWTLTLKSVGSYDSVLKDHMHAVHPLCLLARLRVYPDRHQIPKCGQMEGMNTLAWKEKVMTNIRNLQEPEEQDVAKGMQFLYFVLFPISSMSRTTSLTLTAKVLLSPPEMNRELVKFIEREVIMDMPDDMTIREELRTDEDSNHRLLIEDLPLIEPKQLDLLRLTLVKDLAQDESQDYLRAVLDNCESLKEYMERTKDETDRDEDETVRVEESSAPKIQEDELDSSIPEYKVLQSWETKKRKFQSYPSLDSMAASSPMPVTETTNKKGSTSSRGFSIQEILHLLKPDGVLNLSPRLGAQKLEGRNLCRVDSQFNLGVNWPDSQLLNYHDVYYYRNEDDLRLEKRYAKFRDKGYFNDTRSSFVSPIKKRRELLPNLSPVRRSPRKTSAASLMTRSKSENFQSSSTKRPSPLDTMFKQPSTRPLSKSPRKRRSTNTVLPTSTPAISLPLSVRRLSVDALSIRTVSTLDASLIIRRSPRKHLLSSSANVGCDAMSVKRKLSTEILNRARPFTSSSLDKQENDSPPFRVSSRSPVNRLVLTSDFTSLSAGKDSNKMDSDSNFLKATKRDLKYAMLTNSDFASSSSSTIKSFQFNANLTPEPQVRRSPRKLSFHSTSLLSTSMTPSGDAAHQVINRSNSQTKHQSSTQPTTSQTGQDGRSGQMKRSDRHKLKLHTVIEKALEEKGVSTSDSIYASCLRNLFNVSLVLLKTLPNSQNLTEEMKTVVYGQVQQIINLEKRRSGIAI